MSADAVVLAKNSKRYFYFDRIYNLLSWIDDARHKVLQEQIHDCRGSTVSREELLYLADKNIAWWPTQNEQNPNRASWNEQIRAFALSCAEDERFFVLSDHDGPDYHDVVERDGYVEVEVAS